MPFAEQSGQVIEIGRWALAQALTERERWQGGASDDLGVAVKVSAAEMLTPGFVASVATAIEHSAVAPRRLTLELSERALVRDEQRAIVVCKDLAGLGVQLALDDFGSAYSALAYLDSLPLDTLKIARSFVAKLAAVPASQQIVAGIIDLGHRLGLSVVAEGVETAAQHRWLIELGADYCQGFLFGGPMPAEELSLYRADDGGNAGAPTAGRAAAPSAPPP